MNVSTFVLDRPTVANALDLTLAEQLNQELKRAIKAKQKGLIITAKDAKTFCSGGDLKAYAKMKDKRQGIDSHRKIRKILSNLRKAPLIVIAAIEGDVLGGGCELALACDFVFVSSRSRFSFRQVTQGLTPGWGGTKTLLDRVRPSCALDWLTSGRWISADEGFRCGLIDQVVPLGQTLNRAIEFLEGRNPELLKVIKELVYSRGKTEGKTFENLWFSDLHRKALAQSLRN